MFWEYQQGFFSFYSLFTMCFFFLSLLLIMHDYSYVKILLLVIAPRPFASRCLQVTFTKEQLIVSMFSQEDEEV